jgi:DNA-binding NarL/FixJ family response regulator
VAGGAVIRVVLVDDQPLFRDGLRAVLSQDSGVEVVAEASDGEAGLKVCAALRPEVVLMDLQMPRMNGVEATRRLRVQQPDCKVVVLTTFDEDEWVFDALRAGAVGYLLKDATGARLREAVAAAARGESFLQPSVASKVLSEWSRLRSAPVPSQSPFTEREAEVLKLLVRGSSNKEIAAALFIAEGTVKNHVTAIFTKLEVTDRTQAAVRALERGWA